MTDASRPVTAHTGPFAAILRVALLKLFKPHKAHPLLSVAVERDYTTLTDTVKAERSRQVAVSSPHT